MNVRSKPIEVYRESYTELDNKLIAFRLKKKMRRFPLSDQHKRYV